MAKNRYVIYPNPAGCWEIAVYWFSGSRMVFGAGLWGHILSDCTIEGNRPQFALER
jgi:hypothetical protein